MSKGLAVSGGVAQPRDRDEAASGAAGSGPDPQALADAWRATATAGVDPVAAAVIEALARRAAACQGEARQRLVARVQALIATHTAAPSVARPDPAAVVPPRPALAGLSELVDRLGRVPGVAASSPMPPPAPVSARGAARRGASAGTVPPPAPASLKTVTAFKGTWSRLRAEQRLRQALAQVPAMAGPLNSSQVVHRGLQAMHTLSPAYLDAFLAHVDALMWLEHAAGAGDLVPRAAPTGEGRRRGGASGPRKG